MNLLYLFDKINAVMRISFHRNRIYICCMCIIITILFKNLNSRINGLIFISNKTRKHNLGCRSYYSRSRTIWNLSTKLMIFSPWLSNTVNIGKNIYRHVACFSIRPFQARVASEKGGGVNWSWRYCPLHPTDFPYAQI